MQMIPIITMIRFVVQLRDLHKEFANRELLKKNYINIILKFYVVYTRGYFCSNGVRSPCPPGRYGNIRGLTSLQCSGLCDPGHYCLEGSYDPKQYRCPRGRYGKLTYFVLLK